MWSFFKKDKPAPGRAPRYVYIVSVSQDIPDVTTRSKMRVEATSKEDAKMVALTEIARRSGISLNASDIVNVTGGFRRA